MKVLCLTGLRGVGKDFLTSALIKNLRLSGIDAKRLSFSDELRLVCNHLFPWLPAAIPDEIKDIPFDHPKNVRNLTPRDIWKLVAHDETGICFVNPEVLVDSFEASQLPANTVSNIDTVYIVTDIRKLAEHKLAVDRGFKIIRINPEEQPSKIDSVERLIGSFNVDSDFYNFKDAKSVSEFITLAKKVLGIDSDVSVPYNYSATTRETVSESVDLMFTEQAALNSLYNNNWKIEYDVQTLFVAMIKEFVEMEEEISHINRFFGKKGNSNYSKGLEEFVDVLHYATTIAILKGGNKTYDQDLSGALRKAKDIIFINGVKQGSVDLELATKRRLFGAILELTRKFTETPDVELLFLLGCYLFDLSASQMFCAYLHKNSKNRARVNRGAATKEVDKSSEVGTYSHLYDKSMVSLHPDLYDAKLENTLGNLYAPSNASPV